MKRLRKESADMIQNTNAEANAAAPAKVRNIRATLMGACAAMTYGVGSAFASGPDPFTTAGNLITKYYGKFFGLSTALAVLVACAGFMYMMIGGRKGREAAWSWIKTVALCWLAIQALGGFVAIGQDLTEGLNWQG